MTPLKATSELRWVLRAGAGMAGAVTFMAVSAWLYQPWWEHVFRSDDSPVAWLSSALLAASAAVALKLTLDRSLPWWRGVSLAFALAFLALDEQFLLHERFKYSSTVLRMGGRPWSRWVGDLPTLMVGLAGVVFLYVFTRSVKQRVPVLLMRGAVLLGLVALWADLGSPPLWLARVEEGLEVLAVTLFLCALLEVSPPHVQSSSAS